MQLFHPCMLVLGLAAAAAHPAIPRSAAEAGLSEATLLGVAANPTRLPGLYPRARFDSQARAPSRDARELRLEALRGSGGTRRHDVR